MKLFGLAFGAILLIASCSEGEEIDLPSTKDDLARNGSEMNSTLDTVPAEKSYSHKVVLTSNGDWGYQIFEGAKILIDQKIIPSIQGTMGFDTKEKAEKTALFMIKKLEGNIFPPSVSPKELDSLGVLPSKGKLD